MTREELVEELNNIEGVDAWIDDIKNIVIGLDQALSSPAIFITPSDVLVIGGYSYSYNTTPEKILSVVKALVE